jgi:hypothetical protein
MYAKRKFPVEKDVDAALFLVGTAADGLGRKIMHP